jgi:hypothetical protein
MVVMKTTLGIKSLLLELFYWTLLSFLHLINRNKFHWFIQNVVCIEVKFSSIYLNNQAQERGWKIVLHQQELNIFARHTVSDPTVVLCHWNMKAAIDNMRMNDCDFVSIKLFIFGLIRVWIQGKTCLLGRCCMTWAKFPTVVSIKLCSQKQIVVKLDSWT